jgi:flagellar basal body-associated protein FliL
MASPGELIFGLRTKLIIAFSLVVLAALAIAGSIFVAVRRNDDAAQPQHPDVVGRPRPSARPET